MEIFEAVKALRKAGKLSQQKLANRLGTALSPVQRWEANQVRPSARAMVQLHQLAVEMDRPDLAAIFAFGGWFGTKMNAYTLVLGSLPQVTEILMQAEMRLTQCIADPSLSEFQRGNLITEGLRFLADGRERIDGLLRLTGPEFDD